MDVVWTGHQWERGGLRGMGFVGAVMRPRGWFGFGGQLVVVG